MRTLKLKGVDDEFILVSPDGDDSHGAIATREAFENFYESYAHLLNGQVWRYGKVLGAADDIIEWTGDDGE